MWEVLALATDPLNGGANPVERILDGARRVGREYCWPIAQAVEVAQALGDLQQAVLGFELWSFDETLMPRVLEWSEYRVSLDRPWHEVVRESVQAAVDGLRTQVGEPVWANLTWVSEAEAPHYIPARQSR
jgi:hypothetical protein